MSGHRRRNSRGSMFSLSGLRSLTRSATPSLMQRSATDPILGSIPYHEHKAPSELVQIPVKPAPQSLRMRLRAAKGKASAKLKSLGLKKTAKALEKLPEKTPEQDRAVTSNLSSSKLREQDMEGMTGLRHTRSTPNILQRRVHPLRCHSDVLAMAERPVFTIPPVPRIEVSHEAEDEFDEENDKYLDGFHDAVIYSPSMGNLNSYARHTPSPVRSSYESPESTTDKDNLSVTLITPTRAPMNASDRSKDFNGMARSMIGLNLRENMSGLYSKATGYNKLVERQEKSFEKVGVPRLLKDVDPSALSQPETPDKRGNFGNLGGKKDLPTPALKSSATLNTSHYTSEKTLLAEESSYQHTPKKPSPLRCVYSSDSLTSMEHEQLKHWV